MLRHASRDAIPQRWRARRGARTHRWPRRIDRPDTPDLHVTAVRRLPALAAQLAPFPDALDARLNAALAVARHRRSSTRIRPKRSSTRSPAATSSSSRRPRRARRSATTRRCCNAILQDPSSRALYLFPTKALAQDQLAELQAMCETLDAAATGDADRRLHLRRRHAAGRAPHDPRARAPRAQQSRHGALRHPAAPSALGEAVREPALRRSSTSCTRIAACSAAICATCCGGCGASAGTTDRIRCSSARRRRSPTRASWPSGSPSSRSSSSTRAARRAARSSSSSSTRRSSTSSSASGARISARRGGSRPSSSSATCS